MSDPFRKLRQKENREKKRSKEREMGVSGRSVKLLAKLSNKRAQEARQRDEARRAKEWSNDDN
jgi:hypothetical protein